MERVYFTFGSWEKYPHKNGYMVVVAKNFKDAIDTYRSKYPDIYENCLNCADYHREEDWKRVNEEYYKHESPKEVLVSETVTEQQRIAVLLENAIKLALDEFNKNDLLGGIGTTEQELAELGVDVEEVFK